MPEGGLEVKLFVLYIIATTLVSLDCDLVINGGGKAQLINNLPTLKTSEIASCGTRS